MPREALQIENLVNRIIEPENLEKICEYLYESGGDSMKAVKLPKTRIGADRSYKTHQNSSDEHESCSSSATENEKPGLLPMQSQHQRQRRNMPKSVKMMNQNTPERIYPFVPGCSSNNH